MKENVCIDCLYYERCGKPERNMKCLGYKKNDYIRNEEKSEKHNGGRG